MMTRLTQTTCTSLLTLLFASSAQADFILMSRSASELRSQTSGLSNLVKPQESTFKATAKSKSSSASLASYLRTVFDGLTAPEPVYPAPNADGSPNYISYLPAEEGYARLEGNPYAQRLFKRYVKTDKLLFFDGSNTVDPEPTPVPEPSTLLLWSLGGVATFYYLHRRRVVAA